GVKALERFIVGSIWDRINRNGINSNFDYLFRGVATMNNLVIKADATLSKADSVLKYAKKTNDSNIDVQKQIDSLIVSSGTSDAETIQARGNFSTLNNRITDSFKNVGESIGSSDVTYSKFNSKGTLVIMDDDT